MTNARKKVGRLGFGIAAVVCSSHLAVAQTRACDPRASLRASVRAAAGPWTSPLDRLVTLHARDNSLRDAIDHVAAAAQLRVSYSPDLLPLDRAVCVAADSQPVGQVLADLLAGVDVEPVPAGGNQIVLAPRPAHSGADDVPEMASSLGVLDRVLVTGSAMGAPERESTVDLNVISGRQLARQNDDNLASALDGYVPGVWAWAQSPSNLITSFGSIRGASSFGLSYPKVYVDGIEVANPMLVSHFTPDAIDHIEVIRGPQGSALYGTDAISGVVNIVTRQRGADDGGETASIRSSGGLTQSAFAHGVVRQEHGVSIAVGSSTKSADLDVTGGSIGDFIPNGYSRDFTANASARRVGARTTLVGTARYFMDQAGTARSPLLLAPAASMDTDMLTTTTAQPQSLDQYTLGVTGTFTPDSRWTHSLTAGVDGYSLSNVQTNFTPIPSFADASLRDAEGSAVRGTVRANSVLHLAENEPTRLTLTLSGEQASLRDAVAPPANPQDPDSSPEPTPSIGWQNSTGVGAQANVAVMDALFLTTGLRVEYDSRLNAAQQFVALPMLGVATVGGFGPLTVKLHASYGKGVRPPSTLGHSELWQSRSRSATQPPLDAEVQSGIESGLDVMLRRVLSLHVTRFDQLASGLIQQVAVAADANVESRRVGYLLENVGQISNHGWELEGSTGVGRFSASGTLSFVDSRVEKVASGYTGDLVVGGRMLGVPARTGSFNLSWLGDGWSMSAGGERAVDWINYDQLALSRAFTSGDHDAHDLLGPQLRQYWREYDGGLRLHVAASRDLRNGFSIEIRGDNLLNHQRNEPDNITIVPGRTIMTGLRIKF